VGASVPAISSPPAGPILESSSPGSGESSDPAARTLSLFGLEFSLDTASLDALEAVSRAVTRAQVAEWFARFRRTEEVGVLSTCHRVELALLTRFPEELDRWRGVLPGDRGAWRVRESRDAVHHLFRVAAGRESLAVGEAEVRDQVRAAGGSVLSRHPRPVLRELFRGAARAADEVSPDVPGACSIASMAAARLLDLVGRPFPRVVVVGSGTVGRQVAESLAASARVTVVFHRTPPDDAFLRATGARAARLDRLAPELAVSDGVVTAAKFGHHAIRAADLPRDRRLVLVDLGVPRNIDPSVRELPRVRLVDLEELHSLSRNLLGSGRSDALVEELAGGFSDRLERELLEPWVGGFRRAAEEIRQSELAVARPFLGRLEPNQEVAIDRLTRRLVDRLLLSPTERLRSLPAGPEGDRLRRSALALLRPPSDDP